MKTFKTYQITMTQSRVETLTATSEEEAIEGALEVWRGDAKQFDPDVTDIDVREATPEEAIYADVGLI